VCSVQMQSEHSTHLLPTRRRYNSARAQAALTVAAISAFYILHSRALSAVTIVCDSCSPGTSATITVTMWTILDTRYQLSARLILTSGRFKPYVSCIWLTVEFHRRAHEFRMFACLSTIEVFTAAASRFASRCYFASTKVLWSRSAQAKG